MKRLRIFILSLCTILLAASAAGGTELKIVTLPLTIDYPLLRSLVVYHAFKGPDNSVVVLDEGDGCNFIRISDPVFSEANGLLRCEIRTLIRTGALFRNTCLMPVEWVGYVALLIRPQVDHQNLKLTFRTVDSQMYDEKHRLQTVTDMVWNLIKTQIHHYIDGIVLDLKPPIDEMKSFIASVAPEERTDRIDALLKSLRLGDVRIEPQAVRIDILADVKEIYDIKTKKKPDLISEKEIEKIIETWETWDAFLVYMIMSLSGKPLSEEDRQTIFETLLDTRYRFTTELTERTLEKDLVRDQFVKAWAKLSPVFRNHLGHESSEFTLAYLAFFTATDALAALDRIGPTLGIEISREGLIRLARLISRKKPVLLEYSLQFNRELREILGLTASPPLDFEEDAGPSDETDMPLNQDTSSMTPWERSIAVLSDFFSGAPAWAKTQKGIPKSPNLDIWLPPDGEAESYIQKIEHLLTHASSALLEKSALPRVYHDFYKRLTLSAAWQESCFRQFVMESGKITYLLSYNQTSVGIMQVNRRAWRGIYDLNLLMWNIHYNAAAGCEILELYFLRYALPKLKQMKQKDLMAEETVAGVVYAMYNGGPQQLSAYLDRKKKKEYFLSDRLFMDKFRWTTKGLLSNVENCLK